MANLKILHIDLDTGKIVAKNSSGGGPTNSPFVVKTGDIMTGFLELNADPIDPLHATPKQYVDVLVNDVLTYVNNLDTQQSLDLTAKVNKSGDIMTGFLELNADPIASLHAVPKQYVDDNALFVSGGTMQGFLQLSQPPTLGSHAVTKDYVDTAVGTGSGQFLPLLGGTMTGPIVLPGDPTQELEAATKQYVDSVAAGLDVKQSVRVGTLVDIALTGLQTIDGVALNEDDRVLVKSQTDATQNGIYTASVGSWVRSVDADGTPASEVTSGLFTFIEEGTILADTGWVLTTNDPIILGVSQLQFSKFSSSGDHVEKAGDTMTGPLILNAAPTVALEAANKGYIDNLIQNIGDKYDQVIASDTWVITHNRNTTLVLVQVIEGNEIVIPDRITIIDADTIEIGFGAPIIGSANMVFFG